MPTDAPFPAPRRHPQPRRVRARSSWGGAPTVLALALALLGLACQRSQVTDGLPETMDCPDCPQTMRCSSCHGSAEDPAPPTAVNGSSNPAELGVGAHQAHLESSLGRPVECAECHVVPSDLLTHPDPLNRPAPVVFGSIATAAGAAPTWDRASATCASTYCHGATLPEAAIRTAPEWTRVDGTQKACTSCHGNPPGGVHPASSACENCHAAVAGPGGTITNAVLHIDGKVDVGRENSIHPTGYASPSAHGPDTFTAATDCRLCHGAELQGTDIAIGCDSCHQAGWRSNCVYCHGGTLEASGAPPVDLLGGTSTTSLGVGSHTEHVSRTDHAAFACTECHPAVTDVMTPGHLFDGTPGRAEVDFGRGRSQAAAYAAPGCRDVYCHGTGLTAGSVATFVPAAALTCDSCHPAATGSSGHVVHAVLPCNTCHLDVVADRTTVKNPDLHVNGTVEVTMTTGTYLADTDTCSGSACHTTGDVTW
ncbi:MAG: CxxxxCH/CxxCH domain-containing protein [Polyangiaceae bacterium]|nr:CxxxxCH/CxxCH domain-containing protein [Polyangiaceae bacterium]